MSLKLKLDADGHVVTRDGKPIYIDDANDNEELAFDPEQLRNKISELNGESKQHRLSAKELRETLEKFGPTSPEEVASFKTMLTELGGQEGIAKLKATAKVDVEAVKKSIADAYEAKLAEANGKIESLSTRERQLLIGNGFAGSSFLKETIYTPSKAEAVYGHHFKVEDGKAVGYINGNPILSKDGTGNIASFEEAFKTIFQNDPERDSYTRATGGGSGAQQSQGSGGNGDLSKLTATELTKRQSEPAVAAFIQQKYGGKTE